MIRVKQRESISQEQIQTVGAASTSLLQEAHQDRLSCPSPTPSQRARQTLNEKVCLSMSVEALYAAWGFALKQGRRLIQHPTSAQ